MVTKALVAESAVTCSSSQGRSLSEVCPAVRHSVESVISTYMLLIIIKLKYWLPVSHIFHLGIPNNKSLSPQLQYLLTQKYINCGDGERSILSWTWNRNFCLMSLTISLNVKFLKKKFLSGNSLNQVQGNTHTHAIIIQGS